MGLASDTFLAGMEVDGVVVVVVNQPVVIQSIGIIVYVFNTVNLVAVLTNGQTRSGIRKLVSRSYTIRKSRGHQLDDCQEAWVVPRRRKPRE